MTHGTLTGYNSHHCRCDACRAAYNTYQRQYNATHRQSGESEYDRERRLYREQRRKGLA